MCSTIHVDGGHEELSTARELASWLGIKPDDLVPADGSGGHGELSSGGDWRDCCLCQIDIETSLDRAGVYHYRDDMGDTHVLKKGP